MADNSKSFGKVLRRLRKEATLTQEQLGLEADLQRNYISSLELGEKQPSITTILKIAQALNVKSSHIVKLVEEELEKGAE